MKYVACELLLCATARCAKLILHVVILSVRPNQQYWRAYQGYQHRWHWTTLKYKNSEFSQFFAVSGCGTLSHRLRHSVAHFKRLLSWNYFKLMLSRISWAVAQICCCLCGSCASCLTLFFSQLTVFSFNIFFCWSVKKRKTVTVVMRRIACKHTQYVLWPVLLLHACDLCQNIQMNVQTFDSHQSSFPLSNIKLWHFQHLLECSLKLLGYLLR